MRSLDAIADQCRGFCSGVVHQDLTSICGGRIGDQFVLVTSQKVENMESEVARTLEVGDRLSVFGGCEYQPNWLGHESSFLGTLMSFIPGQNDKLAAVVELDSPISVDGITGRVIVLELRYRGAVWSETETVHVELCSSAQESKSWADRQQGKWVESHATYKLEPRLGAA